MKGNWLNLLGLARRAGSLVAGTGTVQAAVQRGQVKLLVAAADLSPGSLDRVSRLARAHGLRLIVALDRRQLGLATGCGGRGVFGVTEAEFAAVIWSSWAAREGQSDQPKEGSPS